MDFFDDLGSTILDQWRRAHLDGRAFPDVAASVLTSRPPSSHVDPLDVVRWVHSRDFLVPQADLTTQFGQPPVTVFHCEHFYIDVLFWVDGTTAIHQHGFSGAFHVMDGGSLQTIYDFAPDRRYNERLLLGRLTLRDAEHLKRGDVRPILAGSGFIHSLFHLDRPSVSVVVRTPSDPFAGPQYSYARGGLAFDPFAKFQTSTRKLQTLDLLCQLGHPEFDAVARDSLSQADPFLSFQIAARLAKRMAPDAFGALLGGAALPDEPLRAALRAHAEEERRDEYLIARRRLAKSADHRFFLALLLNLPRREPLLGMVRRAYPERPPAETVVAWLEEFSRLDAIHAWVADVSKAGANPADLAILDAPADPAALALLRRVLKGDLDPSTLAPSATPPLFRSSLLRPLFVP